MTDSLFFGKDYADLKRFSDELSDPTTRLGRIISPESIRQSSENINRAIMISLVNNGAAVYMGPDREEFLEECAKYRN
jgi:hypothetical protein